MEQFPALRIPQAEPVLQASLRLLGFVSPGFVPMSLHQPDRDCPRMRRGRDDGMIR